LAAALSPAHLPRIGSCDRLNSSVHLRALLVLAAILCCADLHAQAQLDSIAIHGWKTTTTSTVQSDSLSLPFLPVIALDFERVLTLNRWTYNVAYASDVFGSSGNAQNRPRGLSLQSRGSSILREDTRSLTAETFNLLTSVAPLGSDWLNAKAIISGVTYHSGPPTKGSFFINDPNTQVDGYAILGPMLTFEDYSMEAGAGIARQSNVVGGSYGTAYHLAGSLPSLLVAEEQYYSAEASFDQRTFDLREQLFRTGRARTSLRSGFEAGVYNEISASYDQTMRDFFFVQGSDSSGLIKQRRSETSLVFQDRLLYPHIMQGTDLQLEIGYAPRFVTRRSDGGGDLTSVTGISSISTILLPNALNAYRFSLDGGLRHASTWFSSLPVELTFRARYDEQDESAELLTREVKSTNSTLIRKAGEILNEVSFNSGATQLVAGISGSLHQDHTIGLQATGRIYRHSTPSPENKDDRDDQLFTIRAGHDWRWHPDITASTELRMSQSHIVYLNSARSAQNNVTRAIALTHTSTYNTPNFFHRLSSEVHANYTVLDYYDRLPQLQSIGNYLIRGLAFRDSLLTRLGQAQLFLPLEISFQSQLELRMNERGSYNEQSFTERRSLLITEAGGEAAIGFHHRHLSSPLSLHVGARAFLYTRTGGETLNSEWHEQERQWRVGPLVSLVLESNTGPALYGAFWYAFVTTTRDQVNSYSDQIEAHLGAQFRL
jgi:hypothetical protein